MQYWSNIWYHLRFGEGNSWVCF